MSYDVAASLIIGAVMWIALIIICIIDPAKLGEKENQS